MSDPVDNEGQTPLLNLAAAIARQTEQQALEPGAMVPPGNRL
ncbi:hypothetical protein [Marinobacter fuscus]|nr:hypothetical protein [Marinobacter fuscus]